MSRRNPCNHQKCEHYISYDQVEAELWTDRLSRDAVRTRLIAELLANCSRCRQSFLVEITGNDTVWFLPDRRIDRDEVGRWVHGTGNGSGGCRGHLRFTGELPASKPKRIILERGR